MPVLIYTKPVEAEGDRPVIENKGFNVNIEILGYVFARDVQYSHYEACNFAVKEIAEALIKTSTLSIVQIGLWGEQKIEDVLTVVTKQFMVTNEPSLGPRKIKYTEVV
jgi:hypothetical protein